jgi:predicted alpha-1,6-mannanase (GH76 family)
MRSIHSTVVSMRLPAESGKRLKRMANRHGWTPSDTSERLVEEGLRRSEFGFIDFRDSPAGRQAYLQGSTLAVWEPCCSATAVRKVCRPWRDISIGQK